MDDCIFIKLIHRTHIYATLKVTWDQGHKVKGQGQMCCYVKDNGLGYKSWTIDWIVIKLMHRVNMDATLELTKGQGHQVKGQGHVCNYTKKLFGL